MRHFESRMALFNGFRGLVLIALPFVLAGFFMPAFRAVSAVPFENRNVVMCAIGAASFLVLRVLLGRHFGFFATLEHELTHLLFGLIFLKAPSEMVITRDEGGWVKLYGHNFLIGLAPYFFPTPAYIALGIGLFVERRFTAPFMLLFGAAIAFHFVSTVRETHLRQPDLHAAGLTFSLAFVAVADLVFVGSLFSFISGGYGGFSKFWVVGGQNSAAYLKRLITFALRFAIR